MQQNFSPWIQELDRQRIAAILQEHMDGEVVVIGGGIAGMTTAYYLLRETKEHVTLIEADRIAHGATGHNGGQAVDYFERPFSDIVREFGLKQAAAGQTAISTSWQLLASILRTTKIPVPFSSFIGYAGCTNLAQLEQHFINKKLKMKGKVKVFPAYIADTVAIPAGFYKKYHDLFTIVPARKVLKLLETDNPEYIAALSSRKGCLNSALFVEKLALYLQQTYPNRFRLLEHTPITQVHLTSTAVQLKTAKYQFTCDRVVLCTNGFEHFAITSDSIPGLNKRFHHMITGLVGYMTAYIEPQTKAPIAISYFPKSSLAQADDPYIYLTRRNIGTDQSLICIGGPQRVYERETQYSRHRAFSQKAAREIKHFLDKTLPQGKVAPKSFLYHWHGIMGYTPNNIRCIGPDPSDKRLLYNLGCNGIGLLPSIYGAKKISAFVQNKKLPPSIFDPIHQVRPHYPYDYS